jgi:prevent-host-death family protein
MKVIALEDTNLDACVSEAQRERIVIVITRNGKPVALVVGVEGLDAEQLEFGSDPAFWELIAKRRRQRTMTRAQLEKKILRSSSAPKKHSSPRR